MKPPDAVAIRELEFTASSLIIPAFSATVVEAGIDLIGNVVLQYSRFTPL